MAVGRLAFLILYGQKLLEGFCPLQPETQRKIRESIYRVCNELARLLGRDRLTYEELMALTGQIYGSGLISWAVPLSMVKKALPPNLPAVVREPDLSRLDTQEKLEAVLANAPEPTPEELDTIMNVFRDLLPQFRQQLVSAAKNLPHSRGGAPKKLPSLDEQKAVVDEIKALRGPGVKLGDVFRRVAQRHGVSPSKIKQIWLRWAKQSPPGANPRKV
jgi:hypothetical protein